MYQSGRHLPVVENLPCATREVGKAWRELSLAGLYFCLFFPLYVTLVAQTMSQPIADSANLLGE